MGNSEYKNIIQLEEDMLFLESLSSKKEYSVFDNIKIIMISNRFHDNLNEAIIVQHQSYANRELYSYLEALISRSISTLKKFNASSMKY